MKREEEAKPRLCHWCSRPAPPSKAHHGDCGRTDHKGNPPSHGGPPNTAREKARADKRSQAANTRNKTAA